MKSKLNNKAKAKEQKFYDENGNAIIVVCKYCGKVDIDIKTHKCYLTRFNDY